MTRRGVAFDLEGTLVDVESAHWEGHLLAAREVGLDLTLDEAVSRLPHFVGGPDLAIAEEICREAGRGAPDAVLRSTCAHYERLVLELPIAARPGAYEFVGLLAWLGVPLAIGSVTPRVRAARLLAESGLERHFPPERCVFLEDVARHKPAPDVFIETAERMGVSRADQIVFDDSPVGIAAAVAAGSIAIGTPTRADVAPRLLAAGAAAILLDWRRAPAVLALRITR